MFDIITLGGATHDVFVRSNLAKVLRVRDEETESALLCYDYGAKVNVDHIFHTVGGGATNTGVSFSRMGLRCATVAQVGEDESGEIVLRHLQEGGVSTHLARKIPGISTGYSVILTSYEGERTVLTFRGANNNLHWEDLDLEALAQTKWIYIASLGGDANQLLDPLADFCREHGIQIAFNPGGAQIRRGLAGLQKILSQVTVLVLNREEASQLSGVGFNRRVIDSDRCIQCGTCADVCPQGLFFLDEHRQIKAKTDGNCTHCALCMRDCPTQAILTEPGSFNLDPILRKLKEYGPKLVIVTGGGAGVQAFDGTVRYTVPPFPVKVMDTLGAGDAFASGFVSGYILRNDIEYGLLLGSANAAGVIQKTGAQAGLLSREQAEALISANPEVRVRATALA
ncbi:MAG: PfkB family carbohydrate kinase [Bacteroidota bacterium]